ncbi:MAG: hypothetical protein IJ748_05945 [Bacteroidales bacterium]|nr:hypothetical protein [Bacteroidales bacterium]
MSSPYSRYGIGTTDVAKNQYISSMGSVSQALRKNNLVNFQNPASYTAVDTQSFVFDIGFSMMWKNLSSQELHSSSFLSSLTNIAMAFPLSKSLKVAVGLTPLSDVSYSASDTLISGADINDADYIPTYSESFDASGGLDKLTFGLAYQPLFNAFLSRFSIGFNLSYVFGNLYYSSLVDFAGAQGYLNGRAERNYNVSAFDFDLGLQYIQPLKNGDNLTLGLTLGLPSTYSADEEYFRYTFINSGSAATMQDTVEYGNSSTDIDMPLSIAGGISYERHNKFFIGADVAYTKWSDFSFVQNFTELKDNLKLSFGTEFIPNIYGSYLQKISYRLGMNYDNGYIYLNQKRLSKMGVSCGLSIPIKKLGTNINLSFECGKMGTTDNDLMRENYYSLGLSITAKDRWFVKRKYR